MLSCGLLRRKFNLKSGVLGPLETNCYLLDFNGKCLVIDPGAISDDVNNWIKEKSKVEPPNIYLTHGHFDHIGGVRSILEEFPETKVYISKNDLEFLTNPRLNLSENMGFEVDLKDFIKNLNFIKHGQELKFGDESLKVLDLPGHTPGGTGLYSSKEKMVFVGDTLFQSSIGRTDFPKSNFKSLMKGIMEHLMALPDDTLVLPGHGPTTTIGKERSSNMFIQTEIIKAQRKL